MKKIFYIFILLFTIIYACVPPSQDSRKSNINAINFSDPIVQKIYNFQDKLLTDSLLPYLKDEDPTLRFLAAEAFSSIKDAKALASLEPLLKDEVEKVSIAAACAIGQIGDSTATNALLGAFRHTDTIGTYKKLNATILEAVGKCAPANYLKSIATVSTYKMTDTVLLEGQCYAVYRYLARGITDVDATNKMLTYASNNRYPSSVRFIASNYLARAKNITIDSAAASPLSVMFSNESDYRIRMALAKALGKATNITTTYSLVTQLGRDSDYRVKAAIIDALGNHNYFIVQPVIANYLRDANLHIAHAAADFYINHGIEKDAATMYWALAKDTTLQPVIQLKLYQATNKYVSPFMQNTKGYVNMELHRKYSNATNPQEKVAALRALGEYGWNYKFIKENGFSDQSPFVRTASIDILNQISGHQAFYKIFASGAKTVRIAIFQYYLEALSVGDPGLVANAAIGLRTPSMGYQYIYAQMADKSFLINAQNKLKMPRDVETWNEIQQTIDYFNNVPYIPKKVAYNQPIDWKLLNSYTAPKAIVSTKYGSFTIELFANKTPGSVINFIQLANNGFFNGKNFHRVIRNFVAQGGCPRGDGYGALDYTIRSELSSAHWDKEGLVGMASAGNHTEGTQFFVTHAPTLHLDGNYTLLGKVVEGMDVFHKIQMGDIMDKVVIK
jgi:cyclophilin family peptidyl-prolyl cis-trans isomerase/HEAT repeat protein